MGGILRWSENTLSSIVHNYIFSNQYFISFLIRKL
jgi:hypothetical protein